jgi:hypothetical protein
MHNHYTNYTLPTTTTLTRSTIHSECINNFYIQTRLPANILESAYLLYWEPSYFFSQLHDGTLYRTSEQRKYLVVYHKCTPAQLRNQSQLVLSFRACKSLYDIPAYVLVKPLHPKVSIDLHKPEKVSHHGK